VRERASGLGAGCCPSLPLVLTVYCAHHQVMTIPYDPDAGHQEAPNRNDTSEGIRALYAALNDRIGDRDSMMWQAPAMALTAQAFLLTIALGHDTSPLARALSALLGVVVTVMSIQLMLKHRFFMTTDQVLMIALEHRMGLVSSAVDWKTQVATIKEDGSDMDLLSRVPKRDGLVAWKSVNVWVGGLAVFTVVNVLIFALAMLDMAGVPCVLQVGGANAEPRCLLGL
jgi:hypothetical protein